MASWIKGTDGKYEFKGGAVRLPRMTEQEMRRYQRGVEAKVMEMCAPLALLAILREQEARG